MPSNTKVLILESGLVGRAISDPTKTMAVLGIVFVFGDELNSNIQSVAFCVALMF